MLERIIYLQEIVRCGSFTEAAERCNISQSAISQQIRSLERELGVTLFKRKGRSFTLTDAGEYFYRKSAPLLASFDRLVKETRAIEHQDGSLIRIGTIREYLGTELSLAVASFSEKYPDVEMKIIRGNHEELYRSLVNEDVDIVISDQRRAFAQGYINKSLAYRAVYVEVPLHSSLARAERVTREDLANQTMILVAISGEEENEMAYYREIIGFSGDFRFVNNVEDAHFMMLRNRGFLLVEDERVSDNQKNLVKRIPFYIGKRQMSRHYCVFCKEDNAGYYIEEFMELLKIQFLRSTENDK